MEAEDLLAQLGSRAVLSHEEAARRLGIELVDDEGVRRVTVPRNHSRVVAEGWQIHRSCLLASETDMRDAGAPITTAPRTVADLARVLPIDRAVAAADSALRHGLATPVELRTLLLGARGRGAGRLRGVGRLLDARSGSVLESLLRVLFAVRGLPMPIAQYEVVDLAGRMVARVDFAWPNLRLIVEADGYAFHSDRVAYRRDRARLNELERLDWRVLRFTWEDVMRAPDSVIAVIEDCLQQRVA